MTKPSSFSFDTLSLHAGQQPDPATGSRAVPIYQTTSYLFNDTEHAAALYNLERPGHIYSRLSNPTVSVLEERVAALEGGVGGLATASGMAALFLAIATLMGKGGHIVSSGSLYGGSHNLFSYTLPRFGITTTFVDPRDFKAFDRAITPKTRLIYGEGLGNPGIEVLELKRISEIAHKNSIPFMVASAFLYGDIGINSFTDEKIASQKIRDIISKLTIIENSSFTNKRPEESNCKMIVELNNGKIITKETSYPKGHSQNPLTDDELENKFTNLAETMISKQHAKTISSLIWDLENQKNLTPLLDTLIIER